MRYIHNTKGLLEIALFHPFDTAGKRLMSNQAKVFDKKNSPAQTFAILSKVESQSLSLSL